MTVYYKAAVGKSKILDCTQVHKKLTINFSLQYEHDAL